MTMVPRAGPLSAISARATTSWYQPGKFSACGVSTAFATLVTVAARATAYPSAGHGEDVGHRGRVVVLAAVGAGRIAEVRRRTAHGTGVAGQVGDGHLG